jgi:hypothetical protein
VKSFSCSLLPPVTTRSHSFQQGCDIIAFVSTGLPVELSLDRIEIYREQLNRILTSSEFNGSRQASDFLSYVSGAAFQNRSHVDQSEIAHNVLQRNGDFNPVDDTSVRKLASVTRHKLERYYSTQGIHDPVVVTLAHRLYIPYFQLRDPALRDQPQPEPETVPAVQRRPWVAAGGVLVAAVLAAAGFWMFHQPESAPVRFRLVTKAGDIVESVPCRRTGSRSE